MNGYKQMLDSIKGTSPSAKRSVGNRGNRIRRARTVSPSIIKKSIKSGMTKSTFISETTTKTIEGNAEKVIGKALEILISYLSENIQNISDSLNRIENRIMPMDITVGKGKDKQTFRYDPLAPEGREVSTITGSGLAGRSATKKDRLSVLAAAGYLGNKVLMDKKESAEKIADNEIAENIRMILNELRGRKQTTATRIRKQQTQKISSQFESRGGRRYSGQMNEPSSSPLTYSELLERKEEEEKNRQTLKFGGTGLKRKLKYNLYKEFGAEDIASEKERDVEATEKAYADLNRSGGEFRGGSSAPQSYSDLLEKKKKEEENRRILKFGGTGIKRMLKYNLYKDFGAEDIVSEKERDVEATEKAYADLRQMSGDTQLPGTPGSTTVPAETREIKAREDIEKAEKIEKEEEQKQEIIEKLDKILKILEEKENQGSGGSDGIIDGALGGLVGGLASRGGIGRRVKKTLGKSAGKILSKSVGKSLLKKIPGIGLIAGLGFAAGRAMEGDWSGSALEVASGAASTVPGAGTALSVAADAALAAKDLKADSDATAQQYKNEASLNQMLNDSKMETSTQPSPTVISNPTPIAVPQASSNETIEVVARNRDPSVANYIASIFDHPVVHPGIYGM